MSSGALLRSTRASSTLSKKKISILRTSMLNIVHRVLKCYQLFLNRYWLRCMFVSHADLRYLKNNHCITQRNGLNTIVYSQYLGVIIFHAVVFYAFVHVSVTYWAASPKTPRLYITKIKSTLLVWNIPVVGVRCDILGRVLKNTTIIYFQD